MTESNIRLFENPEFGSVRTIVEEDKVLFCASDVAKALGYVRPNDAVSQHCRATVKRRTPISGKMQDINFIPESDVYRLTFSSKLPNAEKFTDWVTEKVLPDIRKHGMYMTESTMNDLINDPRNFIQLLTAYADAKDKIEEQEETIAYAQETIEHKDNVITGLTDDVPVAELRQRISDIIRQPGVNYKERWVLLYDEFSSVYHINLNLQYKRYGENYKTKIDFVDGYLNMIPQLFAIACNLFENDAKTYLTRIKNSISTNTDAIDVKKQALKQAKARFKKEQSNIIDFKSQKENNVEAI